jgi:two-component system, NtrC family, sensor kinase
VQSFFPECAHDVIARALNSIKRGESAWQGEIQFLGSSGQLRDGHLQIVPLIEKIKTTEIAFVISDLTFQRQTQAEVRELNRRLLLGMRLSSVASANLMLSHSLQFPISMMEHHVRRLIDTAEMASDPARSKIKSEAAVLEKAVWSTMRVLRILHQINRSSETPEDDATNLQSVVEEAAFHCQERFKRKDVCLDIQFPTDESIVVQIEAGALTHAILILLGNAFDAAVTSHKRQVSLSVCQENGMNCIRVTDSGSGILPAYRHRLFEPFFSTKPPGQGSGLGLYHARRIARENGGDVVFETSPQTTTFTIQLPTTQRPPYSASTKSRSALKDSPRP